MQASGTATLGSTAVAANNNITAGSEASLILLQVTGTSGSDLDGTIEVFGGGAGLIIANPNGITCDGCAFTNVSRVDLVTGSGYDADTNRFSTIAAKDINVEGDALELSNVDLNIQTGRDFINSTTIDVENLNVIAGDDFTNSAFSPINANNITVTANNFVNNVFSPINANSFTATVEGTFAASGSVINVTSLTVTANNFNPNTGSTIDADTVTIEVANFANNITNNGTVSATSLNFILTDDFTHTSTSFTGFTNFSNLAITTDGAFTNANTIETNCSRYS